MLSSAQPVVWWGLVFLYTPLTGLSKRKMEMRKIGGSSIGQLMDLLALWKSSRISFFQGNTVPKLAGTAGFRFLVSLAGSPLCTPFFTPSSWTDIKVVLETGGQLLKSVLE